MRYFLDIAYHGGAYHGWQRQKNAISVQEVLEKSIGIILNEPVEITGSGRTDAGVHAEQQFAHLETSQHLTEQNYIKKFNSILPPDISVKEIYKAQPEAHARFDALARSYQYRITRHKNPFRNGLSCLYQKQLDIDKMNEAAQLLLSSNMHPELDFSSFSKVKTNVNHFRCDVSYSHWELTQAGTFQETLTYHITANRFLRGMVRAIVGTLLEIGLHRITIPDFKRILSSGDRKKAARSVEACGLYLTAVQYPKNLFLEDS